MTLDLEAMKAAAEKQRQEQKEAFNAALTTLRDKAVKEHEHLIVNPLKMLCEKNAEKKRQEAEREAEKAAEEARQAVLDKHKKDTGQDTVTEAWKQIAAQIRHPEES